MPVTPEAGLIDRAREALASPWIETDLAAEALAGEVKAKVLSYGTVPLSRIDRWLGARPADLLGTGREAEVAYAAQRRSSTGARWC